MDFTGIEELKYLEDLLPSWVEAKANEVISLLDGRNILDVGSGIGTFIKIFSEKGYTVTAIDMSQQCLDMAKKLDLKNVRLIKDDICNPKRLKGKYDSVVALDILEHIKDERKALNQMKKFLKPSGSLIISVPAFPTLYSLHDKKIGHYRRYRKKRIVALLEKQGFKIEKTLYWNLPGFFGWLLTFKLLKKKLLGTFNPRMNLFYQYWFKLERKIRPPFGTTLILKMKMNMLK